MPKGKGAKYNKKYDWASWFSKGRKRLKQGVDYEVGTASMAQQMGPEVVSRSQLEFLQNLLESDYILCARGNGNYSFRLYEALACGRIPLFIDTDCVLPFDFAIDWKRFGVWVDQVDDPHLRSVADRVAEFHASISGEEFEELQVACRRLWEEWLSPEAFFANFHRHLDVMDLAGRNR